MTNKNDYLPYFCVIIKINLFITITTCGNKFSSALEFEQIKAS